ncbi:MAG: ribose-phosphate pyrophosphokinase [Candidatus Atribacteria bacterium]|nr:ribose-phosphate pyrophosphokinase [Candidatus Atribacteria bacterium]MCD6349824.1 ribose-phosphate pyrophosphokinase [Candidatus Atribacteria bacterium]
MINLNFHQHLKVFSGNANPTLAQEICWYLDVPLGRADVGRFPNGEVRVRIEESVRGCDVFVIQPTSPPANDNLMELLIMIDALSRASAKRVTAVIPFYGYAKQDRKTKGREPISAKLVANLLVTAGASRILTMDLHAGQIQGFFDIPVDNLVAQSLLARYFAAKNLQNLVVVSPDVGGTARARNFANRLQVDLAVIDKHRPNYAQVEVMNIIGDVKDKTVIIVDDLIDTAGTLVEGAEALLKKGGAREVYACATHPVFSGQAVERINNSPIKEVVVTNTIDISEKISKSSPKIKVLSVAPIFAEAIKRIHGELSISELFV